MAAFGAVPPAWIETIGAAEAWGIWAVLNCTASRRQIVTDCLSNVLVASQGFGRATSGRATGARVWHLIRHAVDGDCSVLRQELVWTPAHLKQSEVGTRRRSDGAAVTKLDIRANGVADALARWAAEDARVKKADRERWQDAAAMAGFWRRRLGEVTRASQNHQAWECGPDGKWAVVRRRDSTGRPPGKKTSRDREQAAAQDRGAKTTGGGIAPPPPAARRLTEERSWRTGARASKKLRRRR